MKRPKNFKNIRRNFALRKATRSTNIRRVGFFYRKLDRFLKASFTKMKGKKK